MGSSRNARIGERTDSVCHYAYYSEGDDRYHYEAGSATTGTDNTSCVEHELQRDFNDGEQCDRCAAEPSTVDYRALRLSSTTGRCKWRSKLHVPADHESEYAVSVSLAEHCVCPCSTTSEQSESRGANGRSRTISTRDETRSYSKQCVIHIHCQRTLPRRCSLPFATADLPFTTSHSSSTSHSSNTSGAAVPADPTNSICRPEHT